MLEAISTPTTSTVPPLSIHDLALQVAVLDAEHVRLDAETPFGSPARDGAEQTMAALSNSMDALRKAIVLKPALSLADGAVHVASIGYLAEELVNNFDLPPKAERLAATLFRLALSVLPHVAEAAGLNADAMGWDDLMRMRPGRLAELGSNS